MKILNNLHKVILIAFFFCMFGVSGYAQNSVGINTTTPNPKAVLELVSPTNNQGLLIPSLSTAQRTDAAFVSSLSATDNGLLVFDSDLKSFFYWDDTDWSKVSKGIPTLDDVLSVSNSAASQNIIDLANPLNPQDAATKKYIDDTLFVSNTRISNLFDSITNVRTDISNLYDSIQTINTDYSTIQNNISQLQTDVTNLYDSVTNINADITSLYDSVTNINSDISTLQTDVTNIDARVTSAETNITTLQTDVTNLYDSVTNINTNISNLYDSVTNINTDITTLQTDVTNIDARVTTAETNITTLQTDVTNLYDSVTNINNDITTLQTDVTNIDARVTTAETNITTLQTDVTNLYDSVTNINTNISNLYDSVTNINNDITTLQTDVTNIDARVTTAETNITTLQTDVTNLYDSVTNINTNISNLYDSVTNINNDITSLQTDVTNIDARVTTAETNITTLQTDVTNLYDSVTNINTNISNLYDSVTNINNDITSLQTDVTNIDARVTTAETNITTLQTDVTNLYDSVTNINVNIGNLYDSVTNINTNISNLYDSVTNINSNITNLQTDVTQLQTDVTNIDARVTNAETNITTLQTDVTNLQTDVTNLYDSVTNINVNIGNLYDSVTNINTNISNLYDSVTNINNSISILNDSINNFSSNISNLFDSVSNITNQVNNLISNPTFTLPQGEFFVGDANDTARATAKNTIPISGFGNAVSNVSMGDGVTNYRITNLLDPVNPQDAATKQYVTDAMLGAGLGDMLKATYDTDNDGIADNSELVNGLTVQTAVPAGAVFTDSQTLGLAANTLSITGGNNVNLAPYLDNTDAQTLGLAANTLSISGGNNVSLAPYLDNTDAQDLSLAANTLSLTGDATPVNLAPYLDNTDAQTLGLVANTLSISGGNNVSLAPYLDNTDAQDLTLAANTLSLTGDATPVNLAPYLDNTDNQDLANVLAVGNDAGGVTITNLLDPVNAQDAATKQYVTDAMATAGLGDMLKSTYDTDDDGIADNSELVNGLTVQTAVPAGAVFTDAQTLGLAANTLSISGGNNVSLAPYLDNTDAQTLGLVANTLSISGGNNVSLAPYLDNTDAQDLTLAANTLSLSGDATPVNLAPYLDNTDEQDISISGNAVSITGGTGFNLSNSAPAANEVLTWDGTKWDAIAGGTVTSTSVVSANGFAGTVATPGSTPAITLTTSVNGMVKGNGTALSAAVAGTDYVLPTGTHYIGTTSIANNRASLAQSLTGITSIDGTAAAWTTSRNLAGNSVDGSANVAFANKFIVQGTADPGLSGAQFLGSLATGLVKNTTTTGVLSIATAGTDYLVPNGAITAGTNTKITYDAKGLVTSSAAATLASADYVNQGTTTTILHGNAAGNPSWGQIVNADIANTTINLTTKVTGVLPIANGGTNNGTLPVTSGGVVYTDGSKLMNSGAGTAGQVLISNGAGAPTWGADANTTYTAGEGLNLSSTTFSIKGIGSLSDDNVPRWDEAANEFQNSSIWDDDAGHVHIGNSTISASYALQVTGAFKTGKIYHSSDARWKKNILPIDNALTKVQQLRGVSYEWRTEEFPNQNFSTGTQIGLIAQEVEKVLPELVITDETGYKAVEYANVVAVLIEAIKEQQKIIDSQKIEIQKLQANNTAMQQQVDSLQAMQSQIESLEKQMNSMQALLLILQPTATNSK